jgi:hypothetical protein
MTPNRPVVILSAIALGIPVLLFLTPLGTVTPMPVVLLLFGLTMLYQPFAALGCWAVAAVMTWRRTGTPADREGFCILGTALALGWLLFVLLFLAQATSQPGRP